MSVSALKEGIGPHAMWGMVPAADLLRDGALPASARCKEEVRLLLLQPGDIGHVLKTMACRGRHPANRRISFYVHEPTNEVLARHLLLLAIAHDWEIPIRQRANVFLEVFGNCMVQDRTARYIARLGRELIDLVCSGSRASEHALADIVDLSLLKHRQKDALETIFRSWACNVACDMPAFWDHRLRNFYGQRQVFCVHLCF
jgi:dynein assembly factor 3